jgi:hypothetical protein
MSDYGFVHNDRVHTPNGTEAIDPAVNDGSKPIMAFTPARLAEALQISEETAARIVDLVRERIDYREHPAVVAWARECHHDPRESLNARPECIMRAIDAELKTYGVEPIRGNHVDRYWDDCQAIYCNTGDTYAATILYDTHDGKYRLTSMGDFVERFERRRGLQ